MAIRITRVRDSHETVLQVDGRLSELDIDGLDQEYGSCPEPPVLDLSNLQSADPAGVKCLRELISLGAKIRGASSYIHLLLEDKP